MSWRLEEIANQNFQPGSDYLKSIANQARKAYCGVLAVNNQTPNAIREIAPPVAALQDELYRNVCELPADPVPLLPPARRPSNEGQCACQPYRVNYTVLTNGQVFETSFVDRLGPIGTFRTVLPGGGSNPNVQVGITHRGNVTEVCGAATINNSLLQAPQSVNPEIRINSIVPAPGRPFVECSRPTLPTNPPRSDRPVNPPTINIPTPPGLPAITIPVIAAPIFIRPEFKFEPNFTLDVGGINVEFKIGEVNLTFSPQFSAPITINPPGGGQPSLPPSVPAPDANGNTNCCETIIKNQRVINNNVIAVSDRTIDIQTRVRDVQTVQTNVVVPLLRDIKDCACGSEEVEQVATWASVNSFTFPGNDLPLRYATIDLISGDPKKTYWSANGVRVALVGWYAFGSGGKWGRRYGLQYLNNIVIPDDDETYTSFTFTLYKGLTGSGALFRKKAPPSN